jgi:UDP-glucose 4-epimerase
VTFRYFNACGADSQGRHGQEPGATHIIARVLESVRDQQPFVLNGADYPTPDGTCVRDYVHVQDIADAHVMALDRDCVPSGVYNLGFGTGTSNKQIIDLAAEVTQQTPDLVYGQSRPGDPSVLTADAGKFKSISGWQPQFTLHDMITHAWAWYNDK